MCNPFSALESWAAKYGAPHYVLFDSELGSQQDVSARYEEPKELFYSKLIESLSEERTRPDPPQNRSTKYRTPSDSTHVPLARHDYKLGYARASDEGSLEAPHARDEPPISDHLDGTNGGATFSKDRERGEQLHKHERAEQEHSKVTLIGQVRAIAFRGWMPGLLMCASVGLAFHSAYTNPTERFPVSLVAVVLVTAMLSCATNEFTFKAGEVLGGLLNAFVGMTSSILALVSHGGKMLIPTTALVAMPCHLTQNTKGFALLMALLCLPVVQGSTTGSNNTQSDKDLGPTMVPIGIFLLLVVLVLLVDAFVCFLLYVIIDTTAKRWELQGAEEKKHNAWYHAIASLCFCGLAILMLNYYFDPELPNVPMWIVLAIFTTETLFFQYYHGVYHNRTGLQQQFVPLFVGIILTLFLWITNYVTFWPLAFWASVAICPWLAQFGNDNHDRLVRQLPRYATNLVNRSAGDTHISLPDLRTQPGRRSPPPPPPAAEPPASVFSIGSDPGSSDAAPENPAPRRASTR